VETARLPPKNEVLTALLEHSSVYIHLDPRGEEVLVPNWFKKQPQLVLQIGLNLAVPIRDLQLTERGVTCTLSFNRSPHLCFLPWPSVFALVAENGRGMVWPDDVPPEVVVQQSPPPQGPALAPGDRPAAATAGSAGSALRDKGKPSKQNGKRGLRAVAGGAGEAQPSEAHASEAQPGASAVPAPVPAPNSAADPVESGESKPEEATSPKNPRPSYLRVVK